MAYTNSSAAYNLDLFDDASTASALPQRKETEKKADKVAHKNKKVKKVLTLPEEELYKNRRRKRNPFKIAVGTIGGAVVALVIATIIVGQVQLTELNQQIINAKETLSDSQSIYTQTEMALQAELTTAEIENYAENQLGMTKASNTQKEFVTLSGGDKAEVTSPKDENIFTQFVSSLQNLWS
ncbi:MAG: hypothetical protein UH080_03010 [Ruminococcus sp.]|nr:hypothetical protein [Ruminococcus sp.]